MNIKAALKYQLHDAKRALMVYYIVIYSLFIFLVIMQKMFPEGGSSGMENASIIFIFIAGLNSFKQTFKMFLQNSISRKTLFVSSLLSIFPIAGFMALMDSINAVIFSKIITYESFFEQLYGGGYATNTNDFRLIAEGFLFSICMYSAFMLLGYVISILYYRMNKGPKVAVSLGVPGFFLVLLPIIDTNLKDINILKNIWDFILFILGMKNGFNPYYPIVTCGIVFVLLSGISFLLTRKAVIKN
ncbi:MAG: hypothetical protein K0R90_753 [Oscillospiraceae bacterium]|jgi:hypothetical protein|nr:hypothetical protein [Oscillospiraceae bacterium]